jgi:hypothetical protein
MLNDLQSVAGASGGAVFALLTALGIGPSEVLSLMGSLPEKESLSWFGLNVRLGLTEGEATFGAITEVRHRYDGHGGRDVSMFVCACVCESEYKFYSIYFTGG